MSPKLGAHGKMAAIVCEHIAKHRYPILSAFRTEPDFPEDSGWQFFCGKVEHENPDHAQIWLLGEVWELEPSLEEYINLAPGVQVWRTAPSEDWQIRKLP